jgi:esterase
MSLGMSVLEQIHHQIYGPETGYKGRLVFVHGLMGAGQNWRKIIHFFEKDYQCLAYDQRGHGRSFKPEQGYSPVDYAADLNELTMALGWSKFILIGHSMGGRTAFQFASHYAEKVEKLVIEDIGPEQQDGAEKYFEQLLGVVPDVFLSREEAKKFFIGEFLRLAKTREKVEVIAQFLYTNVIDLEDGRATLRFRKQNIIETVRLGRADHLWNEIKGLSMPTLWVRGEHSQELSQENFQRILSLNDRIHGSVIPGAGHWIHVEQPVKFCEELKGFIEQVKF